MAEETKEETKKEEPKTEQPTEEKKEESKAEEKKAEKTAPTGKFKDLIKEIEGLSLAELSELVKELEERFGVSGMPAAMPMAAGAVSAGGTAGPAGAPAEEKTKFEVVLTGFGENKIGVIKAVREIKTDLGLKEAKDLVEAAPKTLLSDASKEDAEKAKEKLTAAGASVELK